MFHSVTIKGKNTWDDYHMVPVDGIYLPPPPEQKVTTIELKGANSVIDVSNMLTGYPVFQNRSGDLAYYILDPWDLDDYVVDNTKMSIGRLESRIKKYFNDAATNTFFDILRANWDSANKDYVILAAIGSSDTQTAISIIRNQYKGINKNPALLQAGTYNQKKAFAFDTNVSTAWCYQNNIYVVAFYTMWGGSSRRYSNTVTTGNQVNSFIGNSSLAYYSPFTEAPSGVWFNHVLVPLESNFNQTSFTMYCNYDVMPNNSSTTISYPKSLIYSDTDYRPHTMPNAYDVYGQIMNDLHGQTGEMIFEDDPGWKYRGRFTISSFDTKEVRRTVNIHYDVQPYKYKTTQTTKTLSGQGTNVWNSIDLTEADLGTMPNNPSATISGLASGSTCQVQIMYKDSVGQYSANSRTITKTIGVNGIFTSPDFLFCREARLSYAGPSGSTCVYGFYQGRF